jgi:hypothetical protein
MYKDPKETIIKILEIIEYQGNRDKFAMEFINLCFQKTFLDLLKDIPEDEIEILKSKLNDAQNNDEMIKLLEKYIESERLITTLKIRSMELFEDYVESILPTLSEVKKVELINYLKTVSEDSDK